MGVFNKMNITEIPIKDLIPQREPIIMIDGLTYIDDKTIISWKKVEKENIFVNAGIMYESGMIENVAQTAAAKLGYMFYTSKDKIPIGYIGAINNLKIFKFPRINDKLTTKVTIENQVMGATFLIGEILINEELALTCEMKLFIKNEEEQK
jgi:3-hydroxyacyl-[acyl-carrier-protein] dehydratase